MERAVERAGGLLTGLEEADALVWLDPRDPERLAEALKRSNVRWVQLPFAGIEDFTHLLDDSQVWTCAKGIYGPATAELAVALVLTAARQLHRHARESRWAAGDSLGIHRRLKGTSALLVGTGGIGSAVARMLAPHDVRILAVNRSGKPMEEAERTERTDMLTSLVPEADWIVISAALTAETRGLFDAATIALMKLDAWLVNVGRGSLIVTDALVEALAGDKIGGAALDVTDPESLPDDHALWRMENAIITSHTANTFRMAAPELAALVERNVRAFARGKPLEGLVDVRAGY
jgi:phosphoglycerate dehydrogenase-like enzyme